MRNQFQAFILHLLLLGFPAFSIADDKSVVNIGLIAEMGSWEGRVVQSFVYMAVWDFYERKRGVRSRIAVNMRDSKGDSLHAIAAAIDLLDNVGVQAILVPKISTEELFLARLADKAKVPLLSFSSLSSLSDHRYVIQVGEDETDQFHGIAALIKANKWRSFVVLHDDTADARLSQTYIHDVFQENDLDMAYRAAISLLATDDQIINELHKLVKIKASVFVVDLSPSLASWLFANAKMLGMMREEFVWILTSKTVNFLDPHDSSICESMQGVLGFRSYMQASNKLQNLALRWRREFHEIESSVKIMELNIVGQLAYNAAWVLAEAVEKAELPVQPSQNQIEASKLKRLDLARIRVSSSGESILSSISSSRFTGLGGELQFTNGRLVPEAYEILNITCDVERRVGFWTSAYGLTKDIHSPEPIIWPEFSFTAPQNFPERMSGKRLRIGIPANGTIHELLVTTHDPKTNAVTFEGFCMDVLHAALNKLPYKILPVYVPFYDENGSYTDLVNQVYLKTIDAAGGDITILSNRSAYVDFTVPYSELGLAYMVKRNYDSWFFLKPLSTELWIVSACLFILMGSIIWLIEHPINEEFQGSGSQQIGTILWYSVSTLFFAHRERLHKNSSKFVAGVWFFVVLILTSSYTANLSSLLTVSQFTLAKSYHIGCSSTSFLCRWNVHDNRNFVDERLKPFKSPVEYYDAIKKGSKNGGVDAIIDEVPYIKALVARYPREYAMVKYSPKTSGFGFAFPRGSSLVHEMSRAIAELREEGTLLEMEKKWFKSQSEVLSEKSDELSKLDRLSLDQFWGLFLINGASEFIAVLIFLVVLLRKRLSASFDFLTILAKGKLTSILRYLHQKMNDRDIELETR